MEKGGHSRGVAVTGIAPNEPKKLLELYFKNNSRSGGGEIENIVTQSQQGTAQIYFVDPSVAARVAARKDHKIRDKAVTVCLIVEPVSTDLTNTMLVLDVEDKDLVVMYFEDFAGPIKAHEYFENPKQMTITFVNNADLQKALRRECHQIDEGLLVHVKEYRPPKPGPENTMLVLDVEDKDLVEMYFEDFAGPIQSNEYFEEQKQMTITFISNDDLQKALHLEHHQIDEGMSVRVKKCQSSKPGAVKPPVPPKPIKKKPAEVARVEGANMPGKQYSTQGVRGTPSNISLESRVATELSLGDDKPSDAFGDLAVLVKNISVETSKEALWCWLKLAISCFPHTICYSQDHMKAVAHCKYQGEDISQAEDFAAHHQVDGRRLSITALSHTIAIQVHNVSSEVNTKTLTAYFEGAKGHGQKGCVKSIAMEDPDNGCAIVTFESHNAVKRALSHEHTLLDRAMWTVPYYKQLGIVTRELQHDFTKMEKSLIPTGNLLTVSPLLVVTGFTDDTSEAILRKFFGTRMKSAGGNIRTFSSTNGRAVISFDDAETADLVYQKYKSDGLKLCDSDLTIELKCTASNAQDTKLLLSNIGDATDDSLKYFVWCVVGVQVCRIDFAQLQNGRLCAVASFTQPIDFLRAAQQLQAVKVDDLTLEADPVPVCKSVLVKNVPTSAHKDIISLTLEGDNSREVLSCNNMSAGVWIVTFKNACDVDKAMTEKFQYHDEELSVIPYQEFTVVNETREKGKRGRRQFHVEGVQPSVIDFVLQLRSDEFKNVLKPFGCSYSRLQHHQITVVFGLSPADTRYHELLRRWPEVQQACAQFFSNYVSTKLALTYIIWNTIEKSSSYKGLCQSDKKNLQLLVLKQDTSGAVELQLNGLGKNVERAKEILQSEIDALQAATEHEKTRTSQTSPKLRESSVNLLNVMGFCEQIRNLYKDLVVKIATADCQVTFEGLPSDIKDAVNCMNSIVNDSRKDAVTGSPALIDLVSHPSMAAHINQVLTSQGLTKSVVWSVEKGAGSISVTGLNEKCAKDGVTAIRKEFVETSIATDSEMLVLLKSGEWQVRMNEIIAGYNGQVVIRRTSDDKELLVACKASNSGAVVEEVKTFLKFNTLKHDFVPVAKGKMAYICKHLQHCVDTLKDKQAHNMVNIRSDITSGQSGFHVDGNADGIANVMRSLNDFVNKMSIIKEEHVIEKHGAMKHFQNPVNHGVLQKIGAATATTVSIGRESNFEETESSGRYSQGYAAQYRLSGGAELLVMCEDMTTLQCDVIVNAANRALAHSGGLAKAICEAGGPDIVTECTAYIGDHGQLMDGGAMATGPGFLPCKMIVHAVGPTWQDGKQNEINKLFMAVNKSLELADKAGHSSIALPAISSGIFGFPLDLSTKTIVEAVDDYFTDGRPSSLKKVMLVDDKKLGVRSFKKAVDDLSAKNGTVLTGSASRSRRSGQEPASILGQVEQQRLPHRLLCGFLEPTASQDKTVPLKLNGITIEMVKGSIVSQKADVLVNTTSKSLDLSSGAVSKGILTAAGAAIQEQLKVDYPNGIEIGDIAISRNYNLPCKFVFHVSCESFGNDERSNCQKTLQKLVDKCLEEAHKLEMSSIAFPAIGTGVLGFPPDVAATIMYQSAIDFAKKHKNYSMKKIQFILYDPATTAAFVKEHAAIYDRYKKPARLFRGKDVTNNLQGATGITNISDGASTVPKSFSNVKVKLDQVTLRVVQGKIRDEVADVVVSYTKSTQGNGNGENISLVKMDGSNSLYELRVNNTVKYGHMVTRCLKKAVEHVPGGTISFPALGINAKHGNLNKDQVKSAFKAVGSLVKDGKCHLRVIRFVIPDCAVMEVFHQAFKEVFPERRSAWAKLWPPNWFSSALSGAGANVTEEDSDSDNEAVATGSIEHSEVTFTIYGGTEDAILNAIIALDEHVDRSFQLISIKDSVDVITGMSVEQVEELVRHGAENDVLVTVLQTAQNAAVELRSLDTASSLNVEQYVNSYLKAVVAKEDEVCKKFQWQLFNEKGTWQDYTRRLNVRLEEAYASKECSLEYTTEDGQYIVDLVNLKDFPKGSHDEKVAVRRQNLPA